MKNFMAYVRSMIAKQSFVMNVLAEEPNVETKVETKKEEETPAPVADPKPSGTVNFEELIAKARKEERDKLYPDLDKQKERVNSLNLVIGERDKEIARLTKENEKLTKDYNKASTDLKDGASTNKVVTDLTTTVTQLELELDALQTKYETDIQALTISSYREKQIAEANGQIIPELVVGNTEEEVLASIESAKQRYAEITQRAISGVQLPRANPATSKIQLSGKSMQEVAEMNHAEYAVYRKEMGIK